MIDWQGNKLGHGDTLVVVMVQPVNYYSDRKPAFIDPETKKMFQPRATFKRDTVWDFRRHVEVKIKQHGEELFGLMSEPDKPGELYAVPIEQIDSWRQPHMIHHMHFCIKGKTDDEEKFFREFFFKFSDN